MILSGDLVAMLDIATSLFGCAAIVAGLGAVAGALNRISRTINRITVEAAADAPDAEPASMPMTPLVADPHDHLVGEPEIADVPANRELRREARVARRKARAAASDPKLSEPAFRQDATTAPPLQKATPVSEERLESGARAWVQRRDSPEAYAPRRRGAEAIAPPATPAPEESHPPAGEVVRSGTLNGVLYRFYADGSVEAVTPTGLRRFRSMEELRDVIVAARGSGGRLSDPERSAFADREHAPPPHPPDTPVAPQHETGGNISTGDAIVSAPAVEPSAEEQLTPEKRLELFQKNIWATTLAELRRPLDAARQARQEADDPQDEKDRSR